MATYHCSIQVIGRSAGRSVVAAAAYRSASVLVDERTGQVCDYARKSAVTHTEVMAPANTPAWMLDRGKLWNAVEAVERRADAQLAREVEVAIPRELTREQGLALVRSFVQAEFVRRGMVADVAIHEPPASDGDRQPHAHILLTMRDLMGPGFGNKNRDWNRKEQLEQWRKAWADHANEALTRAGRAERVDHRSLEAQGVDRAPTIHLGPAAAGMARRAEASDRAAINNQVVDLNQRRQALHQVKRDQAQQRQVENQMQPRPPATAPPPRRQAENPPQRPQEPVRPAPGPQPRPRYAVAALGAAAARERAEIERRMADLRRRAGEDLTIQQARTFQQAIVRQQISVAQIRKTTAEEALDRVPWWKRLLNTRQWQEAQAQYAQAEAGYNEAQAKESAVPAQAAAMVEARKETRAPLVAEVEQLAAKRGELLEVEAALKALQERGGDTVAVPETPSPKAWVREIRAEVNRRPPPPPKPKEPGREQAPPPTPSPRF